MADESGSGFFAIIIPGAVEGAIFEVGGKNFVSGLKSDAVCNGIDSISWIRCKDEIFLRGIDKCRKSYA